MVLGWKAIRTAEHTGWDGCAPPPKQVQLRSKFLSLQLCDFSPVFRSCLETKLILLAWRLIWKKKIEKLLVGKKC